MSNRNIVEMLRSIERKQDEIMSGLTDLQAAVTNLQAEDSALVAAVTTALADISAEVAALQAAIAAGGDSDAAVEAAAQSLGTVVSDLTNVVTQVTAADPGPQPPPS